MRTARALQLCCCLALVAAGCELLYQTKPDKLRQAVTEFNEGVRWGKLDGVLSHIDPKTEPQFLEMHKEFGRSIQVTDYEVVNTELNLDKGIANVGVKFTWYRIDEMSVHETTLLQRWEERKGNWVMAAEEYRSGTPF